MKRISVTVKKHWGVVRSVVRAIDLSNKIHVAICITADDASQVCTKEEINMCPHEGRQNFTQLA